MATDDPPSDTMVWRKPGPEFVPKGQSNMFSRSRASAGTMFHPKLLDAVTRSTPLTSYERERLESTEYSQDISSFMTDDSLSLDTFWHGDGYFTCPGFHWVTGMKNQIEERDTDDARELEAFPTNEGPAEDESTPESEPKELEDTQDILPYASYENNPSQFQILKPSKHDMAGNLCDSQVVNSEMTLAVKSFQLSDISDMACMPVMTDKESAGVRDTFESLEKAPSEDMRDQPDADTDQRNPDTSRKCPWCRPLVQMGSDLDWVDTTHTTRKKKKNHKGDMPKEHQQRIARITPRRQRAWGKKRFLTTKNPKNYGSSE